MKIFNHTILFLSIIIAIAVGISVTTLFSQSIRLDESQSLWVSTKSLSSVISLTAKDVHVPLYPTILHFWLQIFGTDIVFARTLSLVFFTMTLPVLYLIGKEAGNKNIGLVAVAFFALSPFVIWYSNETRMYTLFLLVTSLNHLFFLRFNPSLGASGKLGYVLSTIAGLYTHYFFGFLVVTQILFVLGKTFGIIRNFEDFNQAPVTSYYAKYKGYVFTYFLLLIIIGLSFLPWLVYVVQLGSASNTRPLIPPPTSYNIFQVFVNFIFGFQSQNFQAVLVALWPLFVLTFFFVFTQGKKAFVENIEYFALCTFLPIILVFAISYYRPIFLPRYLILVTPTLFLVISWILLSYPKKTAHLLVSGFLAVTLGLLLFQNTSAATPVREDYKDVAHYLEQQAKPQDIVALSAPFTIYPIEYYYEGRARLATIPEWNRFAEGSIPPYSDELLATQIQKYQKTYERIHVVLSYDQGYEDNIITYMDGHYELLSVKQYSQDLQVRTYRLRYDTTEAAERAAEKQQNGQQPKITIPTPTRRLSPTPTPTPTRIQSGQTESIRPTTIRR